MTVPVTIIQCSLGFEDRDDVEDIFSHRGRVSKLFLACKAALHGGLEVGRGEAIK